MEGGFWATHGCPDRTSREPLQGKEEGGDDSCERNRDAGMLVAVRRAKLILQIVGICTAAIGAMALPFPQTNPKAITQSFWGSVVMTGAFVRPGVVLIFVGLGCLALAALLPSGE